MLIGSNKDNQKQKSRQFFRIGAGRPGHWSAWSLVGLVKKDSSHTEQKHPEKDEQVTFNHEIDLAGR